MLEAEMKTFATHSPEWRKQHTGKFVLVKGEKLAGIFNTQVDALAEGARNFGLDSFLVRQLGLEESPSLSIPALTMGILRAHS